MTAPETPPEILEQVRPWLDAPIGSTKRRIRDLIRDCGHPYRQYQSLRDAERLIEEIKWTVS